MFFLSGTISSSYKTTTKSDQFPLTFVEKYIMSISRDPTKDQVSVAGVSFVNNLSFDIQSEKIIK